MSRARRAWVWIPALLMVVITILNVFARSYADSYYFFEDQLSYYAEHPADARFAPSQPTFAPIMTVLIRTGQRLGGLFGSWALWSVGLALVCLLSGQREVTFGAMIRLVLWCWIPYSVRGLLQCGYMALSHDPIFNPGLSGLILDNTPPSMGQYEYVMISRQTRLWGTFLSYADVYLFWNIALVSAGLRAFTELSPKRAWAISGAVAAVWVALSVALDFWQYKY